MLNSGLYFYNQFPLYSLFPLLPSPQLEADGYLNPHSTPHLKENKSYWKCCPSGHANLSSETPVSSAGGLSASLAQRPWKSFETVSFPPLPLSLLVTGWQIAKDLPPLFSRVYNPIMLDSCGYRQPEISLILLGFQGRGLWIQEFKGFIQHSQPPNPI